MPDMPHVLGPRFQRRTLEGEELESAVKLLSERSNPRVRWANLLLEPRAWARLLTFGDKPPPASPSTGRGSSLKAPRNAGDRVHKLIARLETLPKDTPERDSRLAQLHLLLGRHDRAAQILETAPDTPLAFAMRLMVLSTRYDFEAVIEQAQKIDHTDDTPLGREARARSLLALAIAHHGQAAFGRALEALQQAFLLPGALPGFTERVWALREQCHTLAGERHPLEQEQEFRTLLDRTSGLEARYHIEELLLRLLEKTGRYAEAAEIALHLPDDRLSHAHRDLLRVAAGTLEGSEWLEREQSLAPHLGAMNAMRALHALDADAITGGLAPPLRVESAGAPAGDAIPGVDGRSFALWNLALAWAFVDLGQVNRALEWLQNAFVPRSEWDARFLKNLTLIEAFVLEPNTLEAYYNVVAVIRETRWLVEERLSPAFPLLPLASHLAPHAVALLLVGPDGCPSLEPHARTALAVLSTQGLRFSDVHYRPQISAIKLLLAPDGQPRGMSPGMIRKTRHYLKSLFEARGNPGLVRADRVYRALERILESSERGEDRRTWREAYQQYRAGYGQLVVWSPESEEHQPG
jgi:tetratricopeptide (TPR) repeat protein